MGAPHPGSCGAAGRQPSLGGRPQSVRNSALAQASPRATRLHDSLADLPQPVSLFLVVHVAALRKQLRLRAPDSAAPARNNGEASPAQPGSVLSAAKA